MMRYIKLSLLAALLTGLAACGGKSGSIVGPWKVVDLVFSPDSLNHSEQFKKSGYTKLRFTFNADSTMEISDGSGEASKARYSLEDSGNVRFLVLRPLVGQAPALQGAVMEQRLKIVQHTAGKLDLEQKFDQVTVTTRLEPVRD